MPPVFAHGRLRLYLLKLLDEAPRHGYEVIRQLEERFQGLYVPSAGTVYPRLAKLEAEGLVTHTTEGGRKVYSLTDAGRAELAARSGELIDLELEVRESVAKLATEIRTSLRGAVGDLRREIRATAAHWSREEGRTTETPAGSSGKPTSSSGPGKPGTGPGPGSTGTSPGTGTGFGFGFGGEFAGLGDNEAWHAAKEEMRRAMQEWKEQARRARDENRRAHDEAQHARHQAKEAQEEVQRIARRVQEQVQDCFSRSDRPAGLREGLNELVKEMSEFGKDFGFGRTGAQSDAPTTGGPSYSRTAEDFPADFTPVWAHEDATDPTGDPARELDRLLDRFRDGVRDAARDHDVTPDQLREARRHLSTAAARIGSLLHTPEP